VFRVVENGRVQTVGSLEELAKWLQRGKLDERAELIDIASGVKKPAYEWLTGYLGHMEAGPDHFYDFQSELARKLSDLKLRDPGSFSDDEILAMKRYLRYLVKNDLDKEMDPGMLADFRKTLRRTSAAQLQSKQEVTIPIQQMLRPGMTGQPARGSSQVPPVTYSKSAYTGNLAYRTLPGTGIPDSRPARRPQAPPPSSGMFGKLIIRLMIIIGVLSWLVNSGKLDLDIDAIVQQFIPHTVVTIGSGFDQSDWKPETITSSFSVGDEMTYAVTYVDCAQSTLGDSVVWNNGGESQQVVNRTPDWQASNSRYMGRLTVTRPGTYTITIRCGAETIAEGQAYAGD
jgi:hypothetical protein